MPLVLVQLHIFIPGGLKEGGFFCFTLSYTHSIPLEHLSLHRVSFQVKMFDKFYYGINKRCQRLDQQLSNILLKFTIKNVIKQGGGGAWL